MRKNFKEAFDTGDLPDMVHPSIKGKIESGDVDFVEALPENAPEEAQSYLEKITSDSYKKVIERVAHYTGVQPPQVGPSLLGQVLGVVKKVMQIESSHKHYLENLALDIVLELPEYKPIRELFYDEQIDFDIKLQQGELQNALTEKEKQAQEDEPEEDGGLSEMEQENLELAESMIGKDEMVYRRALENALIQGEAMNKMYMFNMVRDQIEALDPELFKLYGVSTAIPELYYWVMPHGAEGQMKNSPMSNSEELTIKDGKFVIKVRALTFPVLLQELVKGIEEYIYHSGSAGKQGRYDTLEGERFGILAGAQLVNQLRKMIGQHAQEDDIVILKQMLLNYEDTTIDQLKDVLRGNEAGRKVIQNLVAKLEQEFPREKEQEDEPWRDSYGEDEGEEQGV